MDEDMFIVLQKLTYKLRRVPEKSSAGFKIRKVPDHLRTENVKAYEPQIIAIGPLNRHLLDYKTHLAEMEKHKVLFLQKLLQRRWEDLGKLERISWVRKKLSRDLLLADNQLPMFLLQEFCDITKMHWDQETDFGT
ncbi:hypothetical protein WN944_026480 [Citrus x changshan-huyou]|uniref:Uncharacterized protein n=1 Tax=Citrus x changshan-huyou TaxID=2935761 RepID=A0AAP0LSG6_9ROSI